MFVSICTPIIKRATVALALGGGDYGNDSDDDGNEDNDDAGDGCKRHGN